MDRVIHFHVRIFLLHNILGDLCNFRNKKGFESRKRLTLHNFYQQQKNNPLKIEKFCCRTVSYTLRRLATIFISVPRADTKE